MHLLEAAFLSGWQAVVVYTRALVADRLDENPACGGIYVINTGSSELFYSGERMKIRGPEYLVGVDVADACDETRIHECLLDAPAFFVEEFTELFFRDV